LIFLTLCHCSELAPEIIKKVWAVLASTPTKAYVKFSKKVIIDFLSNKLLLLLTWWHIKN